MKSAKNVFDRAQAQGKTKKPFLRLGEQLEGGGVKSTGAHKIVLIRDESGKGTDAMGNTREELQVTVSEGGVEKQWNIPLKDAQGNLHYLVQRLAEFGEGEEVIVEMKKRGLKNYIDVRKVGAGSEEIPSIDLDEDSQVPIPRLDDEAGSKGIRTEDIPF